MNGNLNFENTKGDTFDEVAFQLRINGVNVNLTGATIKMQLKKRYCDLTPALSLTSVGSAGITITNASAGQFKINSQIINIPVWNYVYDLQIAFSNGEVKTYIKGNFNILEEVTV
jgi:hypothetical protein